MTLNLTLKVWRQAGPDDPGHFEVYKVDGINEDASFLEMLDVLNERLIAADKELVRRPLARAREFTAAIGAPPAASAIVSLLMGSAARALTASAALRKAGFRYSKVMQHWEGLARFDEASALAKAHGGTARRVGNTGGLAGGTETAEAAE